jgi:hypothetical protein
MPCPDCNPSDRDNPPEMPEGQQSLDDESKPIRALPPPPRCKRISIGDGNYTGCEYGYGDQKPFTGPCDCPICRGWGIEGYGALN